MVWKIYKVIAFVYFQCALIACCSQDALWQLDEQTDTIDRLIRIIGRIREYSNLHPNYIKDTYGDMEAYLQKHISRQDWALLNQLQIITPVQAASHHQPVLEIA
ncbi:hypothetical protein [Spirosoma aerophilum]